MAVSFLPSQIGAKSQTPLSYTADPRKLLLSDFALCYAKSDHIFGILRPFRFGKDADPFDELYPSRKNLQAIFLHTVLVFAQLGFIVSVPFFVLFPMIWCLAYVALFYVFNSAVCRVLNGSQLKLSPDPAIAVHGKHDSEYWIYLNGVSVGRDWLQSNIDRLSLTFGRQVYGVHNPTDGIIFDLIQCLIQRNFCYSTEDVRAAYASIKEALSDDKIQKVVFILHSQGGIEGSLIIDWLLAEVPQDHLHRLEVYTFGNASNHFNNPQRSGATPTSRHPFAYGTHHSSTKAIGYIEHYANTGDFVSQIGVLNNTQVRNRFMGRVFVSPYSGHLLNQHYLHQMFPLDANRQCCDSNDFMDMEVAMTVGADDAGEREGAGESMARSSGVVHPGGAPEITTFVGDVNSPVSPLSLSSPAQAFSPVRAGERVLRVKDFSRLWLYRNGASPPDAAVRRTFTA